MKKLLVIYRRELAAYFNTPIAYIFLPIFIGFLALFFLKLGYPFFLAGSADMRAFFGIMPWALFIFAPALTLRLWSDELRIGTAEILLTLPYEVWQLVLGKFLAASTVLAVSLVLTAGVPFAVAYAGDPDWGPIVAGYLGALLAGSLFVALGAFVSSMTQNQVIALLVSLLVSVLLVLAFSDRVTIYFPPGLRWLGAIVEGIGVGTHFTSFERGTVELRDVVYFITATMFFIALNIFRVAARRY